MFRSVEGLLGVADGRSTDLPIERFRRDRRSFFVTEGPAEILKMALARQVLRAHGGVADASS